MGTKIPCLTTWRRLNINGAPHWTRTSDPLFRRQLLFPAELTEHKVESSLSCAHAPRLSAPFCWGSLDRFCKRSKCPCINNCCSTGRHCNSVRTKALERMTGVEPARFSALEPKSSTSTDSVIWAFEASPGFTHRR